MYTIAIESRATAVLDDARKVKTVLADRPAGDSRY